VRNFVSQVGHASRRFRELNCLSVGEGLPTMRWDGILSEDKNRFLGRNVEGERAKNGGGNLGREANTSHSACLLGKKSTPTSLRHPTLREEKIFVGTLRSDYWKDLTKIVGPMRQ